MKNLLSLLLFASSPLNGFAQQTCDMVYIYRNDGERNSFFRDEVRSLCYSRVDVVGKQHDGIVTQIVETIDSTYFIPLAAIDSICMTGLRLSSKEIFRLSSFDVNPFSSSAQGMDIYQDEIMFQAGLAGNIIYVLDLYSKRCLGTIIFETPSGEPSHMNNINCGNKYESTDRWPLLYLSQTQNSHACFVIRLSNDASSYDIVQTIKYVGNKYHVNSLYDWFIDIKNGFIYTYGYYNGKKEEREIVKFPLPSDKAGDIIFTDYDVIDSFVLKDMSIYQGTKIINGFLFAPVGYGNKDYPGYLKIIDLGKKKLKMSVDIKCGEPESIGKYKNGAIICGGGKDSRFYYIKF